MPIKKKLKILLVEDDVIAQVIGKNIIEQAGYNLDIVNSTQKALGLLKHKKYDLIFMDLGLPDASGIEFTKELSENVKITTPIIAVTAFNRNNKKEECIKNGFKAFIEKPFSEEQLQNIVKIFGFSPKAKLKDPLRSGMYKKTDYSTSKAIHMDEYKKYNH